MATHDYVIANGTGASVRSDLNNALAAIVSNNSSSSEPSTRYAYQWWADTTTGQLKLRNAANNGWVTIFELDGTMLMEDGAVGSPGLAFASDTDTGFFRPAANQLAIATNGVERAEFGTSEIVFNDVGADIDFRVEGDTEANLLLVDAGNDAVKVGSGIQLNPSGRLLIGTTTEGHANGDNLTIADTGDCGITIRSGTSNEGVIYFSDATSGNGEFDGQVSYLQGDQALRFATASTERVRIDGNGNVGINQSSINSTRKVEIVQPASYDAAVRIMPESSGNNGQVQWFSGLSQYGIGTTQGTDALKFKRDATEMARFKSTGTFLVGQDNDSLSTKGHILDNDGRAFHIATSNAALWINRLTDDGDLVNFFGQDNKEGSISVNGSTVSYNGAHLSRYSQLSGNAARTEILRGSVLSNLDEMCEWAYAAQPAVAAQDAVPYTEEDELPEGVSVGDVKTPAVEALPGIDAYTENNEQLNRMKVSDVEGDKNVSGVFQSWDDDDKTYTNDFYCAMTGDFVIRIAQGTTVARGDLLMSAGDGTAKPQDDDIVRSKTIAKVTSTSVSETYADNSYCVPCVLMAC